VAQQSSNRGFGKKLLAVVRASEHWTLKAHVLIIEAILLAAALIEGIKYLLFLIQRR